MVLWCDADFRGNWKANVDLLDRSTANQGKVCRLRCHWSSRIQTEMASTRTEADFIALIKGLRICMVGVHCKVLKTNQELLL